MFDYPWKMLTDLRAIDPNLRENEVCSEIIAKFAFSGFSSGGSKQ